MKQIYYPRQKEIIAEQFTKHGIKYENNIIKVDGSTGYNGKLGYIKNKYNNMMTIRPGEWLVDEGDSEIKIINDKEFQKLYEIKAVDSGEKITYSKKEARKTVDIEEDNAEEI